MTKIFRHLALCVALLLPLAGSAFADHIGGPGFVNPANGYAGYWIGTYTGFPSYPAGDNYAVAQLIPSNFDYSNLSLTVELFGLGTVDFSLAPNENGTPGAPIATDVLTLTSRALNKYTIPLDGASLQAGTWYWLLASSPDVEPVCCGNELAVWTVSPGFDFPLVVSQNGGPWTNGAASFAYEFDGVPTSQDFFSAGPPPISSPEPNAVLLLICGIGVLAAFDWGVRRRAFFRYRTSRKPQSYSVAV